MTMRVATFAQSGQMIADALRVQAKTADLQMQEVRRREIRRWPATARTRSTSSTCRSA